MALCCSWKTGKRHVHAKTDLVLMIQSFFCSMESSMKNIWGIAISQHSCPSLLRSKYFYQFLWHNSDNHHPILSPCQFYLTTMYISFIRIEKSPFSQWRRNSKVNSSSGSHRKNQTRTKQGKTETNKKQKTHTGITPVQEPSTVYTTMYILHKTNISNLAN